MSDRSDRRRTLAPHYPSELPDLPTTGRRWVALVLLATIAFGFLLFALEWLFFFL